MAELHLMDKSQRQVKLPPFPKLPKTETFVKSDSNPQSSLALSTTIEQSSPTDLSKKRGLLDSHLINVCITWI